MQQRRVEFSVKSIFIFIIKGSDTISNIIVIYQRWSHSRQVGHHSDSDRDSVATDKRGANMSDLDDNYGHN